MSTNRIHSYSVYYRGEPEAPGAIPWRATIHLFGANPKKEKTPPALGKIRFVPPERLKKDHVDAQGLIAMFLPEEKFPAVLDLLRNEKPLRIEYNSGYGTAFIYSGREPIGEGED